MNQSVGRRSLLQMAAASGLAAAGIHFSAGAARAQETGLARSVGGTDATVLLNPDAPADPTEVLRLWPEGAPGGEAVTVTPVLIQRSTDPALNDRIAELTVEPVLTVLRPERPNGTAMLLIPGGGYRRAVIDKEGMEVARPFVAEGTTCFVLRYRLPADGWTAGPDVSLQDAQRAVRLIRSRASDYGLQPGRMVVLGASAGGHIAGLLAQRTDETYAAIDDADRLSFRPDLTVLLYPVVTMTDPHVHAGSRSFLLGQTPRAAAVSAYSLEQSNWTGAAPVFLLHAMDDRSVPVENGLMLLNRLRADGVPVEAHFPQSGGHGFGVRLTDRQAARLWPEQVRAWAAEYGVPL